MCWGSRVRLAVHMTDEDIITRVGEMWGVKVLAIKPRKAHHKPSFRVIISGARALDWMLRLRPVLGTRRQEQVDKAESEWKRPGRRGSLLHPHDLRAIVAAVEAGEEKIPAIATRFGIRRESVYRIARRAKAGASPLMRLVATST